MSEPTSDGPAAESAAARAQEPSEWRRFGPESIERRMLLTASDAFGTALRPQPLVLTHESRVEVEGIDQDRTIVVQLVANQGAYKPAYRNKVMADMFKLLWLRSSVPTVERAVLIVTDVASQALGGWVAIAAEDLGVEVYLFAGDRIERLQSQR